MKNFARIGCFVVLFALALFCCYHIGMYAARCVAIADGEYSPPVEATEAVEFFDTSSLERWGGCGGNGTIRMVGATFYEAKENSTLLIDETGHIWELENQFFNEWDFILLWIGDSHTPTIEDDCVIKVWIEHYEVLG